MIVLQLSPKNQSWIAVPQGVQSKILEYKSRGTIPMESWKLLFVEAQCDIKIVEDVFWSQRVTRCLFHNCILVVSKVL